MNVVAIQKPPGAHKMKIFNYDFIVKYYPESEEAKVPYQATIDSAGYDLYAAEENDILPRSNAIVSLDLRWAITKDFFGKIFSRSGLFLNHSITAEAGVIDSGYRGIVKVLLCNHSDKVFSVKLGQRISQIVFMDKFDVNFEKVERPEMLDKSERNK